MNQPHLHRIVPIRFVTYAALFIWMLLLARQYLGIPQNDKNTIVSIICLVVEIVCVTVAVLLVFFTATPSSLQNVSAAVIIPLALFWMLLPVFTR